MSAEILGRYPLAEELGRGGMSVVYRAFDPMLHRDVAVKVLHPHLAARPDSRARFSREARAIARLTHPNIVEIYDFAPPESDRAYIVTELITGPTLRDFAQEHPPRHSETAALLLWQVAEALDHAHRAGIVHRDVKPENIMLRGDGTPVLMDFGVAQMVEQETLTATGTMLGSPAHMAPEVVDGAQVNAKADVFSLGTVLYWLVSGSLPFSGPNPAALFRKLLECRFDPLLQRRPQAGRAMARLVERCLTRRPEDRPTSRQVADELRALLTAAGIVDPAGALKALVRDPGRFEDELVAVMVPSFVAAARAAVSEGATARALGWLDRVLVLDEVNPDARSLLAQIEGRRRPAWLLPLMAGLVGAALLGAGAAWWRHSEEAPSQDATVVATTGPAQVDAVAPLDASALDASLLDAAPDARALDASPDAQPDAASASDARPKTRIKRTVDASPRPAPPAPVLVEVHGEHKGAVVSVDGRVVPGTYLYKVETAGGLKLLPGRHTLTFDNPSCEPDVHRLDIAVGQLRVAPVVFSCRPLPATLRVKSNLDTYVRELRSGTVVGRTNQLLRLPMSRLEEEIALTVGDPTDSVQTRTVRLVAGKTVVEEVLFPN